MASPCVCIKTPLYLFLAFSSSLLSCNSSGPSTVDTSRHRPDPGRASCVNKMKRVDAECSEFLLETGEYPLHLSELPMYQKGLAPVCEASGVGY